MRLAKLERVIRIFFLDLAKGGKVRENKTLRAIMAELGCPVILNQTHSLFTLFGLTAYPFLEGRGYDPSCFWVINQFYKILKQGRLKQNTYRCEMIDWCRESFKRKNVKDLTEDGDSCFYSPWLRTTREELQLCSFGRFWTTWKLAGITPYSESEDRTNGTQDYPADYDPDASMVEFKSVEELMDFFGGNSFSHD